MDPPSRRRFPSSGGTEFERNVELDAGFPGLEARERRAVGRILQLRRGTLRRIEDRIQCG